MKKEILYSFFIWRIALFLTAYLSGFIIGNFGSRFPYYKELLISTGLPFWIWGFGNFDGVHYLTIAQGGYIAQYTQTFFPLFPLLIKSFSFGKFYFASGLIVSNILFIFALYFLYKLFILDYKKNIATKAVIFLLAFPTAFYFGSIYSESLFLLLAVLCILFSRKKMFLYAGFFSALATSTRIIGIFLIPVIIFEFLQLKGQQDLLRDKLVEFIVGLAISASGLMLYMLYLNFNFKDPFFFLNAQPYFGAQRTAVPHVFLPQVIFRYIKIFFTTNLMTLQFLNALLEFMFTIIPLGILITNFKKIRKSYLIFTLGSLILPTMTGTFSSMPRYTLMSFLLFPLVGRISNRFYYFLIMFLISLQFVLACLFIRGYWVA